MPTSQPKRRVTVLASGLLCGILALVVIFTNRSAFFSPMALVVVAAVGAVAVLLQVRLRNRDSISLVHPPVWLNLLGIVFALAALFTDRFRTEPQFAQLMALCAVGSFAISSAIILHSLRKPRIPTK